MIWFTSDTHFGHEVALRSCERPWAGVGEMNGALVDAINEHVEPGDTLYHLGNHDKDWAQPAVGWAFTVEKPITVLKIGKLKLVLSHFPMADWQSMSHGSIHLHGHIHSRGMQYNELNRMQGLYRYDVGVDANGFRPVSLDEVLAWFEGVPCSGRVDWRNWVNETGSKAVSRKLAGCK